MFTLTISVPYASTDEGEIANVQVSVDGGLTWTWAEVLTFTVDNWDEDQTVYMRAVDDDLEEGNRTVEISHSIKSEDENYDQALIQNVSVDIRDNDNYDLIVEETDYGSMVIEGGETDTYTIRLTQAPTDTVTVTLALDSGDEGQLDIAPITITLHCG